LSLSLEGKVAFVTGAARGIGRAIALALSSAGADVAIADLHPAPFTGERYFRMNKRVSGSEDGERTAAAVDRLGRRSMEIELDVSVPEAVAAAEQLVADRGWELAVADPASGRVEATETVSIYRFKDDIVLRITPNPNGDGSVVNMRSVSRVGISDLGVNGDRIRAFLTDLEAATSG
jgi:NAD(P)-dependent dehydrogenase (short-subunit alcohol dehydrogenase family)